jgi:hypothetical protein
MIVAIAKLPPWRSSHRAAAKCVSCVPCGFGRLQSGTPRAIAVICASVMMVVASPPMMLYRQDRLYLGR